MNLKDLATAHFKAHKKRALDIAEELVSGVRVLRFSGDLDIKTLPKAKKHFDGLLDGKPAKGKVAGPLKIVIDLEETEYIDSSGLGFFIGSLKKVKEQKGDLKLAHLNAYMMGIFKLINMHHIIEIHENLEKAIKSFGSPRRAAASSGRA